MMGRTDSFVSQVEDHVQIRLRGEAMTVSDAVISRWFREKALPPISGRLREEIEQSDGIGLTIQDGALRELPWEDFFRQIAPEKTITRRTPVPARIAAYPATLPFRLLQLELPAGRGMEPTFDPATVRTAAIYSRRVALGRLDDFRRDVRWPGIDVLHLPNAGYVVARLAAPRSTLRTSPPGTLGWLERLCFGSHVRLLVLEGSGEDELRPLRVLAGALADRGGPTTVITAPNAPFMESYRALLDDLPITAAFRHRDTLVAGPGGEDHLRMTAVRAELGALLEDRSGQIAEAIEWHRPSAMRALAYEADGLSADDSEELARALDDARRLVRIGEIDRESGGTVAPTADRLWTHLVPDTESRFLRAGVWVEDETGLVPPTAPLIVGRHYLMSVDVGLPHPVTTSLRPFATIEEVAAWDSDQDGDWADVGVTALGLAVRGSPVQQVRIPKSGPGQRLTFVVEPGEPGIHSLRICLYIDENVVQSIRVAAVCAARADESTSSPEDLARSLDLTDDALHGAFWGARAEYALHRLDATTPPRTISFVVDSGSRPGVKVFTGKGHDWFDVAASTDIGAVATQVRTTLEEIAGKSDDATLTPLYRFRGGENRGTDAVFEDSIQKLAQVGWRLYTRLFNEPWRKKLGDLLADEDAKISVASVLLDAPVPWAFLYDRKFDPGGLEDSAGRRVPVGVCSAGIPRPDGSLEPQACEDSPSCLLHPDRKPAADRAGQAHYTPDTVACLRRFWGFRHQIELPAQQTGPDGEGRNAASVVNTGKKPRMVVGMHSRLTFTQNHLQQLRETTESATRPADIVVSAFRRPEVIRALKETTDLDVIYLYCHADGGAGTGIDEPALRFPAHDSGPREELIEAGHLDGPPWPNQPLIILNGCRTAAYRPDALSPFLRELIHNRGAGGLLGTEVPVFEELAVEVGDRILRYFLDGKSAGMALLLTRRRLLAKRNPLGLAYTLYAQSDLHLGGQGPRRRPQWRFVIHDDGGALAERRRILSGPVKLPALTQRGSIAGTRDMLRVHPHT